MPETTLLIKAALNLRVGAVFDVYVFTVAKHSMLMPAMMLRHISPDNSRAGIVTSPNVATRLSEKLVLR